MFLPTPSLERRSHHSFSLIQVFFGLGHDRIPLHSFCLARELTLEWHPDIKDQRRGPNVHFILPTSFTTQPRHLLGGEGTVMDSSCGPLSVLLGLCLFSDLVEQH